MTEGVKSMAGKPAARTSIEEELDPKMLEKAADEDAIEGWDAWSRGTSMRKRGKKRFWVIERNQSVER